MESTEDIKGTVVRGIQKGRKLGFPTANIKVNLNLDSGIYAGYIVINEKKYRSALYSSGNEIIEAFIFDFSGDLYGKDIIVEMVKKIRDKMNFKTDEEAIQQITKDVATIRKMMKGL